MEKNKQTPIQNLIVELKKFKQFPMVDEATIEAAIEFAELQLETEQSQRIALASEAYEAGKLDQEFSNMFDDPKARFMNSVKDNKL